MRCRSRAARGQNATRWLVPMMVVLIAMICSGCTYEVSLIPREGGGRLHASTIRIDSFEKTVSGRIDLLADGIRYSGIYVSMPSDYGLTLLKQYDPQHGDLVLSTSDWYGQASLQGPDGRTLRCEYKGRSSKGGIGVCVSNEGKIYEMLISPH